MNSQSKLPFRFQWSEILPWTIIFRSLNVACSFSVICLALVGVVTTPMGWIVSEKLFVGSADRLDTNRELAEIAQINRSPYRGVFLASTSTENQLQVLGMKLSGPWLVFDQMVKPFLGLFSVTSTLREYLYYLVGSMWTLVVWSFAGLGIARVALLRLTRNDYAGLDDAYDYVRTYYGTCLLGLAMPMGIAFVLCIPAFFMGIFMGFDLGALMVGLGWIFVLGFAFVMGLLLLGLFVGWPLIVCSVAAEGQNAFDALTRAYAYIFQRPVNYLFYAVVAVIFGGICWLVVHQFTESVIRISFWSTSWGANRVATGRIDAILALESNPDEESDFRLKSREQSSESRVPTKSYNSSESQNLKNARRAIHFWSGFAKTVAAAFIHGLFWCLAAAIYLLLRKDLDEVEMDEIYMINEQRTYDLPPLKSDEHGIPQVQPLSSDPT